MRKFILSALLLVCLSLSSEETKIALSFGQSTLAMEDFNNYTQNNMILSQMNFEKIKTGTSINISISKKLKKMKNIDLDLTLGYLSASTSGIADSLLWYEYSWQSGQKREYNIYAIPVMFSIFYSFPTTNYFSPNLNLSIGTGISYNTGIWTRKIQTINLDGVKNTSLSHNLDDCLGYHLSSILSYKINNTFHVGVKGLYRISNFPKMNLIFGSEFGLDFSGFEVNIILGVSFN